MANLEQQQSFTEQLASEYRRGYKSGHASGARQAKTGDLAIPEVSTLSTSTPSPEIIKVLAEIRDQLTKLSTVVEAYARANHL